MQLLCFPFQSFGKKCISRFYWFWLYIYWDTPCGEEVTCEDSQINYFSINNLFTWAQQAYTLWHSASTASVHMMDQWFIHERKVAGVVFLNLTAAFNVTDPNILIAKLRHYGFLLWWRAASLVELFFFLRIRKSFFYSRDIYFFGE